MQSYTFPTSNTSSAFILQNLQVLNLELAQVNIQSDPTIKLRNIFLDLKTNVSLVVYRKKEYEELTLLARKVNSLKIPKENLEASTLLIQLQELLEKILFKEKRRISDLPHSVLLEILNFIKPSIYKINSFRLIFKKALYIIDYKYPIGMAIKALKIYKLSNSRYTFPCPNLKFIKTLNSNLRSIFSLPSNSPLAVLKSKQEWPNQFLIPPDIVRRINTIMAKSSYKEWNLYKGRFWLNEWLKDDYFKKEISPTDPYIQLTLQLAQCAPLDISCISSEIPAQSPIVQMKEKTLQLYKALEIGDSRVIEDLRTDPNFYIPWYAIPSATDRCLTNMLKQIARKYPDNKSIFLLAFKQHKRFGGEAYFLLTYASPNLRDDREVVTAAIEWDPCSLKYASERLKNDKKIVELAITKDGSALKHASALLQTDKHLIMKASERNKELFNQIPRSLRENIQETI